MLIFIKALGIFFICAGIIFFVRPQFLKQYTAFWKDKKRLQIGGVIAILFGIAFLMSASACRVSWLFIVLGIWSIVKGLLLLIVNEKKTHAYLDWWNNKPVSIIRFLGLFAVAIGILVFYAA